MLCLLLSIAALAHISMGQGVYYVKPTNGYHCFQQPCDTLSGYMENIDVLQNDNIKIIFLPGKHTISRSIKIKNIHNVTLQGPTGIQSNVPSAKIECTTQAYFMFTNILALEINGLSVSHCGVSVRISGVVIYVQNLQILLIKNSCFSKNLYGSVMFVSETEKVLVSNSLFDRNSASKSPGGAIEVFKVDKLEIKNSNFTNNNCSGHGGAMVLESVRMISINDSNFVNNSAYKGDNETTTTGTVNGGGISIFGYEGNGNNTTQVTTVIFDGVIMFENNFAQERGGGLYAQFATLSFLGATFFYNNTARSSGGALVVISGFNVTICEASFMQNQAVGSGGAAVISNVAFLSLVNCTFIENSVAAENSSLTNSGVGSLVIFGLTDSHERAVDILIDNMTMTMFNDKYAVSRQADIFTKVVFKGVTLFQNNSAMGMGGGVFSQDVVLDFQGGTYFINNYAAYVGGGMALLRSRALFNGDTYIEHNIAYQSGGGISSESSILLFRGKTTRFFKNCARKLIGGGLYVIDTSINFTGTEIIFSGNEAYKGGGGISGFTISLIVYVERISFTNNTGTDGGAIYIAKERQSSNINNNLVNINCNGTVLFVSNYARKSGGCLHLGYTELFLGGLVLVKNNEASEKGGWLFAFERHVTIKGIFKAEYNRAKVGGVIFGKQMTIFMQALYVEFNDNTAKHGGTIAISEYSKLYFTWNSYFTRNYAERGGVLFLRSFSRISTNRNINVLFSSNHALQGGAIYVDDYSYVDKKECFFESFVLIEYHLIDRNSSVKQFLFYNNTADKGHDLYGGYLDRCRLDGNLTVSEFATSRVVLHYSGKFAWSLLSNSTKSKAISSDPMRVCFCTHNSHNCTYKLPTLSKYRGQMISFSAVVVDQVENPLSSVIRAQFPKHSNGQLGEGEYLQTLPAKCSQLTFQIFSPDDNEILEIYSDDGPYRDLGISKLIVTINLLPCPLEFQLSKQNTSCVCHKLLQQFTNSCNVNSQSIQREGNYWFSYENKTFVSHHHCPFDYCVQQVENITFAEIDKQCAYNHSGTLCGACKTNLSLSFGSSQCQSCQQASFVWLTLLFAMAGILLVIFLLIFRFTVAVGTINGLIFYANIVAVNKALLFPPGRDNPLLIFIAWLNLDVGIETCYYNGMDMYGRTWLQFIFPLYVWALVALIVLVSHYSTYAAKIFGRNPVSVLATLFLLSYTKLLRTIITVFSVGFIEYPEKKVTKAIWLYDGNINYLLGKQIPLFTTALIFLVVLFLPYTFLLLFGQCLRRLPRKRCLGWTKSMVFTSVMDAYHAPYKNKHRYWTGLMLLVRCVLFLTFSFNVLGDPNINLLAITTMIILVVTIAAYLKVYRNEACNFLELSFIINLALLTAITHQIQLSRTHKVFVSSLSVSVAFLTFTAILIYHSYIQLKDTTVWRKIQHTCLRVRDRRETNEQELIESVCQRNEPTSTLVDLRELREEEDFNKVQEQSLESLLEGSDN